MTPTQPQLDLAELRRLAEAATPGPWRVGVDYIEHPSDDPNIFARDGWANLHWDTEGLGASWRGESDAAYIAAANPQTILRLLDLLEDTETDLRRELAERSTP